MSRLKNRMHQDEKSRALAPGMIPWILLIGLIWPIQALAQEENPVGKVIGILGTVEFKPGGAEAVAEAKPGEVKPASFGVWRKVQARQPVYAKDTFRTSRKSRLKILFSDNSLMGLGPSTEMKVESYLFKAEDKLRQGVINIVHGLSTYIVNKSQNHKNSSFRIVTPTANIAARGTHGHLSASDISTFLANQAGSVDAGSSDPGVSGTEILGAMMKTVIALGLPPTTPGPLTLAEVEFIQNLIMSWVGTRFGGSLSPEQRAALEEAGFGDPDDFAEYYEFFDDIWAESCGDGGS